MLSCLPGNAAGPFSSYCNASSWFFEDKYCSNAFCKSFKTKRDCKYPCMYSKIHGCLYNIDYQIHVTNLNIVCMSIMSFILEMDHYNNCTITF